MRARLPCGRSGRGAIENGVVFGNARITIAWVRCTPLTIVDLFTTNISDFTRSSEALGRLLQDSRGPHAVDVPAEKSVPRERPRQP